MTITTGSSTGVAPPARPVPLPRATNGRPCRAATRTAAATSSLERGKQTAAARAALDAGVACVERELERLGARPVGAERRLEIGDERAVVSDDARDYRRPSRTLATDAHAARTAPAETSVATDAGARVGHVRRPGRQGSHAGRST